jgi:hypothetical protein
MLCIGGVLLPAGSPASVSSTRKATSPFLYFHTFRFYLGPTAAQDWYRDVLAAGERAGATEYFVTLDQPLHANVTGDAAYIVSPATMTFKVRGKRIAQSGAIFTTALHKSADGWRIAAWAWAKGTPVAE